MIFSTASLKAYCSRILALLLPCMVAILGWAFIAAPLIDVSKSFQSQGQELLKLIEVEHQEIAMGPAWHKALIELQTREARTAGIRVEPSEALAAAGLQNDIQKIAEQLGGQIVSVEPLPPAFEEHYEAISMQVSMTVPASSLAELLRQIEGHQPYMFLRSASFQTAETMSGSDGKNSAGVITLLCIITAYRRS